MADAVRFHLDEHMDPDIAAELRRRGVDVSTTLGLSLRTADDGTHWVAARNSGRVIVTNDVDFLVLAASTSDHPGVVFCDRSRHTIGEIIRFLLLIHGVYDAADMRGQIEYL